MFKLPSSSHLRKLSEITSVTLGGATCQAKGANGIAIGKKKRSIPSYTYSIFVDYSTEEILGNFRSEYEYGYEYEFSVLSTRTLKNVDLET